MPKTPPVRAPYPILGLLCASVLSWCFYASPSFAQERRSSVFHPDSSYNAETLLKNAAMHVREAQWSEAIEVYQRVVEQFGDSVAVVPRSDAAADPAGSSTLYMNARSFCQAAIAGLPPEAQVLYRQRVDARAEKMYKEALATSDLSIARRVVGDFYCSSWGDDALNLLGDLAFREGNFAEALTAYRALVPDEAGGAVTPYPDPEVDKDRIVAKKLLCRAAMGASLPQDALTTLQAADAGAKVTFAGRNGPLTESLSHAIEDDHWGRAALNETRWPTFGGAPDRNGRAPEKIDIGSFQWKVDLKAGSEHRAPEVDDFRALGALPRGVVGADLEPGVFPIVVGDLAVVALEDRVAAYHLNKRPEDSRKSDSARDLLAWQQLHPTASNASRANPGLARTPRTTLTASGDRIIARLGSVARGGGGGILCAMRSNREVEGKLLWRKPASEIPLPVKRGGAANGAVAAFEGTPVADDSRVYVALTEAATETWVYVACLDAETGRVIWVRFLGNASSQFDPMRQMQLGGSTGNRLLTLANQSIYYQTNMGAMACLDAENGSLRWLATYPTKDTATGAESKRGLNPAVYADGLVVVAPEDSTSLFAFDARNGNLVWKTQPIPQITHVLGSARGKLFATGDRVYTIELATGKVLRAWPEAGLGMEEAGRGLLAGDQVYWPTKTEIAVLDQETGGSVISRLPISQAFGYGGGNLALGDGFLVVAQRDRLIVFCQNRRLIERYRLQIAENPDRATAYFQLARVAEATNQTAEAAEGYRQAIRKAGRDERTEGRLIGEEARVSLHRLLQGEADAAGKAQDWQRCRTLLSEAVELARTDPEKLMARLKQAEVDAQAGDLPRSVQRLQEILADDRLARLTVPVDGFRKERADLVIIERLRSLIALHGRAVYEPHDQAAARLLDRGREQGDIRTLADIGRNYPLSLAAPEALLELGRLSERKKQWFDAAGAYKRLLSIRGSELDQAYAQVGLARSIEAAGDFENARSVYRSAAERFGAVRLESSNLPGTVESYVKTRLSDGPHQPQVNESAGVSIPLERGWVRQLEPGGRPLLGGIRSAAEGAGTIFLADGNRLLALSSSTGETLWKADLVQEPVWVSQFGEAVIAASALGIQAFQQKDGMPLWRFEHTDPGRLDRRLDPFAFHDSQPQAEQMETQGRSDSRLHRFQIQGTRLYFLSGDHALNCLDILEGGLEWSFEVPGPVPTAGGPRLNPHLFIAPDRVVVQLGNSRTVVVLDSETGLTLSEFVAKADGNSWLRDPVPLNDDQILLVTDARTVVLFDMVLGSNVWSYQDDSALPLAASPRVFTDRGSVLVMFGGQHLTRLDPSSGKRLWSRGVSLEDLSEATRALVLDQSHVYCASVGRLVALRLDNGSTDWARPLAEAEKGWGIMILDSCLVAFPQQPSDPGRLQSLVPMLIFRRDAGELVQRLEFPCDSRGLDVRLDSQVPIVMTDRELWALRPIGLGE